LKKRKRIKKGFTLLELLAVIVILALIALIAVPIILNVINDSKEASTKVGVTNYMNTLEKELSYENLKEEKNLSGKYIIQEDGSYQINGTTKKLAIKGKLPNKGTVCINEKGIVESYSVVIDGYVVTNTSGTQKIDKGKNPLGVTCDVTKEMIDFRLPEDFKVCSQSKLIEIDYPELEEVEKQYRITKYDVEKGETTEVITDWTEYKGAITLKENVVLSARLKDKRNGQYSEIFSHLFEYLDTTKVTDTAPVVEQSSTNPTSEMIVIFKQTDNCGIDEETIQYGKSETANGEYEWQDSAIFSGLKNNTTYYFKTKANDIANNEETISIATPKSTGEFGEILITATDGNKWTQSKEITITGKTTGSKLQYQLNAKEEDKWIDIEDGYKFTLKENANIYARLYDGKNESEHATLSITMIDPTAPSAAVAVGTIKTDRVTLTATCSDSESGITKYEFSKDGGSTWDNNGTTSTKIYTGLTQSSDYTFKVKCTNGSGIEKVGEQLGTTYGINAPTVTTTSGWATSKVVTATYNATNISSPSYYFKGTVAGTAGTAVTQSCGTGNSPGTCTTITSTTSLAANTWYKVSASTKVTVIANGSFYAVTSDGTNMKASSTLAISSIDRIAPSAPTTMSFVYGDWSAYTNNTWTNQTVYAARVSGNPGPTGATDTGGSGIAKYQISSDGTNWVDYSYNTSSSMYVFSATGTYTRYFRAVDGAGNVSSSISRVAKIDKASPPTPSSELRYGSSSGTLRGTASTWTNQTLWWGNFSSTDTGGSGTSYYQYSSSCSGTASGTLNSSYTYSSNANAYYCIRAVDAVGNASAWSSAYYIRIDKTAPGTASSTIRINNASGTVRANTTAWTNQTLWWGGFTATDTGGSGVSYYQYSTGCTGSASANLGASYTYSSNTNYAFCIRAVDAAGNAGAWSGAYYIRVDKTAPICGTWSGGGTTWTTGSRAFSITCTDALSQCTASSFSTNYSSSAKTGNVTITIKDNAGNTANCTASKNIYIDNTKPTITMSPAAGKYTSGTMSVVVSCSDSHSGMKQAWLSDAGYETTGTTSTSQSLASIKERTAQGRCTDNVGNYSTTSKTYNIVSSGGGGTSCTTYYGQPAATCAANGWTQVSCSSGSNCTCQKC